MSIHPRKAISIIMVLNVIMYICTCIMPILVYCGIKLNRGNHSGPIKERGTQTPQQDIEPTEQQEPSSSLEWQSREGGR